MSHDDQGAPEAAFAEAIRRDPFGPAFDVGFDPRRPRRRVPQSPDAFEAVRRDIPFVQPIRHLPTARTLRVVAEAYGAAASELTARWAAAWSDAGLDVEGLAPGSWSYEEGGAALARQREADDGAALDRLFEWEPDDEAALALVGSLEPARGWHVRTEAQHALEDAARSLAIMASSLDGGMLVSAPEGRARLVRRVRGVWRARLLSRRSAETIRAGLASANAFWATRAFAETSGRATRTPDGMASLALTLLAMARAGEGAAFLKDGVLKGGTWVVDLDGVDDVDGALAAARRAMGGKFFARFATARRWWGPKPDARDPYGMAEWRTHAGRDEAFLVQQVTPFVCEHRFFVVDDRIVVSTPSVRTLSVLDARSEPGRLDPRVSRLAVPAGGEGAYDRGESVAVEDRRLVAAMARTVRRFCRIFAAERRASVLWEFGAEPPDAYVVDVGLTDAGVVAVIEVNTTRNAGLYAADPARILEAMGDAPWTGFTRGAGLPRWAMRVSAKGWGDAMEKATTLAFGKSEWVVTMSPFEEGREIRDAPVEGGDR